MEHTPKTCDDCSLTWDRKGNPKDVVLCPLHKAAPALLSALEEAARLYHEAKCFILGEVDRERFPSYLECPYWPCIDARAAILAAKGDK